MKGSQHGVTTLSIVLLAAANLLLPIAIYVFGTGFFPYKPLLPGLAVYDDSEHGPPPAAPFDRSLIRDGSAIPFTAHATSPTVTMPRIKAITTGSIPSFLDVILNIDEGDESSSLASQDTWLAQMKAKNSGKLLLYGDDTWLKLFPGFFDRADGTSSFFVADFTEVDNNVTRHVPDELQNNDWNTMVLHYLGLDHIGHKGGPRSMNMIPKQIEMDGMVKQIYTAIESQSHLQSTLLILLGDHGMNDAGNHGGSAPGETSPALVFLSPKLKALGRVFEAPVDFQDDFRYYSVIEQSDLAPTLGALLGFPAPKNNLGAFISDFLPFWPHGIDRAQILMRNAEQILAIISATFGGELFDVSTNVDPCVLTNSDVEDLACRWWRLKNAYKAMNSKTDLDDEWAATMSQWLRDSQRLLSSMASNYDIPRLTIGQMAAIATTAMAVFAAYQNAGRLSTAAVPITLITAAYGVMMFASSYVEEEHHFWYYTATAWFTYISWRGFSGTSKSTVGHLTALLFAFVTTRVVRGWNQTGQKFAGEPDIVKIFLQPEPVRLWALISITYLWLHRELLQGFSGLPRSLAITGSTGLVLAAFTFKLAFTNEDAPELVAGFARSLLELTQGPSLVVRAQAVFVGLALAAACVVYFIATKNCVSQRISAVETLHHLYTLLAVTQSRATNVPLFLLFDIIFKFLSAQGLTLTELTVTSLLLQYASFFALGGTNAISSVDLSSAYNGVRNFDVATVGVLTFVSNWAAPIYWVTATNVLLVRKHRAGERSVYVRHITLLTVFAAASVASVMAACTALRTHLFIWTVFSPKYLYCVAWTLGQHLIVNIGAGGLLYWLGTL
ncbi:alkaline phosphatase-like protein [Cryphonectria parasitica EP155]|uniref:GPI ethanolamine phosphate transferase 2 n=1 Tax=Cryphonectria parasitica (strain ATCC 38755 / EP155) TaxID=660469 RepID=A0A9P4YBS1_CRYP1|nr:alkaline phosphatase-like protein [Cryphonectria parasitica EP155]KAF3770443.1 alkaline phosphatase-like protein [Cryphonectria parasitica EP155]